MSSILIDNGNLATPQLAPGARLQYLQDGTLTGYTKYCSQLGAAGSGLSIGSGHPYNSAAKVSDSQVTYQESHAEIDSNYIGIWSSAVQKVTCVASTSANQIQQCPNWVNESARDGALKDFAIFDVNGIFAGFPYSASGTGGSKTAKSYPQNGGTDPYRLGGVTSFYQGATTIRITYCSVSSATVTSALSLIGTIADSLVAGQISYSFDYYAFVCTSVTYEETPFGTGSAQWTITEEWLLLPPPGADPAIYG